MIDINTKIGIPKYKQIINAIEYAIQNGSLHKGDQLPSVNTIKSEHNLSRDTVLRALNELKSKGIIQSVVGKGYYVSSENVEVTQKIFLLFDELNSFKEDLYKAFINNLEEHFQVDIFFHHFNEDIFDTLICDHVGAYHWYVIMPANLKNTNTYIKQLPHDKVYILDQIHEDLLEYPAIYQNFEKDIFKSLSKVAELILKYNKLFLLYTEENQPIGMKTGFVSFCRQQNIAYEVINSVVDQELQKGELYVIPDDKNLLRVIKKIKNQKLSVAKDIGIISYNDTLLKEVVEDGITTITTDFNEMGKRLAEMILRKEQLKIENPNHIIVRNSL